MKPGHAWILSLALLTTVVAPCLPAQDRYLRIQTNRIATAKKELAEAASQGFRVRAGVGCCGFVLEKVAQPPAVYEYLWIEKANDLVRFDWKKAKPEVESQLKEAGAKGFRVVQQAIVSMDVQRYEQFVLMEKPPGTVTPYEYRLGPLNSTGNAVRPIRIIWEAGTFGGAVPGKRVLDYPQDAIALLEYSAIANGTAPPNTKVLRNEEVFPLEHELRKLAAEGYRVLAAAETELSLVLERANHAPKYEYSIVGAEKTAAMEQQLNQAGSSGYRLIPRAFGKYDKPRNTNGPRIMGVQVEAFAVLEREPGSSSRYEYVLAPDSQQLQENARLGYEVVAVQDFKDKSGVVVLERRRI